MSAKKKNKKKSNKKKKNYNSKVRQNQNTSNVKTNNQSQNQNEHKVMEYANGPKEEEHKVMEYAEAPKAEEHKVMEYAEAPKEEHKVMEYAEAPKEESMPQAQETIVIENLKEKIKEQAFSDSNYVAVKELEEEVKTEEHKEETVSEPEKTEEKESKEAKKEKKKKEKLSKEEKEKALIKNAEKRLQSQEKEVAPEYVQKMLKNKKRKKVLIGITCCLVLFVIGFSTLFALANQDNQNILKGVAVENIDISNMSKEEAKERLRKHLESVIPKELELVYGEEYNAKIEPEQIDLKYDIDATVEEAYNVGRDGTLLENNYKIIGTRIFGTRIPFKYTLNEETLEGLIDNLNNDIPGSVIQPSYYIDGAKLYVDKGKDGILIDNESLVNKVKLGFYRCTQSYAPEPIEIPVNNVKADDIDMEKIYSAIYCEPKDAYYETEPFAIYPDTDGIDLTISVDEAKKQVAAEDKDEYVFDLKISKAAKTIKDLGAEAFPYLISTFSTKYDASNINRSTNLEIAAGKINGKVLMPGETFSYNETVGKRTIEEGYKDAKIYANGQVVDGLAGGICQVSSTLYNSALLANLEIVERRNHSFPASYIGVGRDATVVYGVKDLKFKNNRTYPIRIEASVKAGICQFDIHGLQEEKEYEVKILPVTTGTIPTSIAYQTNPAFAPGQQAVIQSGHVGYRVTTYKELIYNGETISKEVISNDTYSPMQTIISVGPAAPVQ